MACKQESRVINGHQYFVVQMPATKALKTKLELMAFLGNAIPLFLDALAGKNDNSNEAIEHLMQNIAKPGFFELLVRLVKEASRDNEPILEIDSMFSGELKEFWEVVLFVLEVNYKDFLQGIGSLLRPQSTKPKKG